MRETNLLCKGKCRRYHVPQVRTAGSPALVRRKIHMRHPPSNTLRRVARKLVQGRQTCLRVRPVVLADFKAKGTGCAKADKEQCHIAIHLMEPLMGDSIPCTASNEPSAHLAQLNTQARLACIQNHPHHVPSTPQAHRRGINRHAT